MTNLVEVNFIKTYLEKDKLQDTNIDKVIKSIYDHFTRIRTISEQPKQIEKTLIF